MFPIVRSKEKMKSLLRSEDCSLKMGCNEAKRINAL